MLRRSTPLLLLLLVVLQLLGRATVTTLQRPAAGVVTLKSCGAVADGRTDNHAAIVQCLYRAAASRSRELYFPRGVWRSSPLVLGEQLISGLTLHFAPGATLAAIGNASTWPISAQPCIYAPFLHITGGTDLTISGPGTIDGRGRGWWERFYSNRTFGTMCDRPFLLVIDSVTNLTVRDVTLLDSASETFILNNVSRAEVSHINVTAKFYPSKPEDCYGGYDPQRGCEPPNTDGIGG